MKNKKKVEIFIAGCYLCDDVVKEVQALACSNCDVTVYDLNKKCETAECEEKAKQYGIRSVPAVAINGQLVNCCQDRGVDVDALRIAGLGQ